MIKDFQTWLKAKNESMIGRGLGSLAGHVANVPGQIKNQIGQEIQDFKTGYSGARAPTQGARAAQTAAALAAKPATTSEPDDEEEMYSNGPTEQMPEPEFRRPIGPPLPQTDTATQQEPEFRRPIGPPLPKPGLPIQQKRPGILSRIGNAWRGNVA